MTSRVRGLPAFLGAIGAELDEEDGRRAVRIAARNAADAGRSLLHPGEGVAAVLRTTVYLVCSPGFTSTPRWPTTRRPSCTSNGAARPSACAPPSGSPHCREVSRWRSTSSPWPRTSLVTQRPVGEVG